MERLSVLVTNCEAALVNKVHGTVPQQSMTIWRCDMRAIIAAYKQLKKERKQ